MCKSVDFFIETGMDLATAEYFASGRKKLQSVRANHDYTISLFYEKEEERIFDMKHLIKDGVFSFLQDNSLFSRVYLDDSGSICWDKDPSVDSDIVWSNKVDLCPDSCYVKSKLIP